MSKEETDRGRTQGRGQGHVRTATETGLPPPNPRVAWSRWRLEEAREDCPPEPSEGRWPCPHPDCRLLASGVGRGPISAALSPPVCGNLLRWPEETSPGR